MDDGALTADNADAFIKNAFGSTLSATATVYLMNVIRFIPFIAVIPLILALVAKLVLTYLKDEKYKKYITCLKIEFSYIAVAALISALAVFVCGFFLAGTALNILPLIILSAVMLVRTVALLVGEYLRIKKEKQNENPTE